MILDLFDVKYVDPLEDACIIFQICAVRIYAALACFWSSSLSICLASEAGQTPWPIPAALLALYSLVLSSHDCHRHRES